MLTDFYKSTLPKDKLKAALEVIQEYITNESELEWIELPGATWARLEELESMLTEMIK